MFAFQEAAYSILVASPFALIFRRLLLMGVKIVGRLIIQSKCNIAARERGSIGIVSGRVNYRRWQFRDGVKLGDNDEQNESVNAI
jgi:hypothetical protein